MTVRERWNTIMDSTICCLIFRQHEECGRTEQSLPRCKCSCHWTVAALLKSEKEGV